ncbi:hypothetical protein E2C01_098824 [Portunus trituberculatus]|uniref:Uncharacterized protein n=1 Tax=Portunus trituberculatus TaxID=210409 RepID=A0A5B7KDU7_PORTR|nr:hypothetical protein [Portunus trituberculatus]
MLVREGNLVNASTTSATITTTTNTTSTAATTTTITITTRTMTTIAVSGIRSYQYGCSILPAICHHCYGAM